MAYAISDGPPCLEGSHAWTAFDGTAAPVFNAGWTHTEDVYISIAEPSGFYARADADDNRDPRVGQPGEIARPSELLGKTIVYRGALQARTLQALRTAGAQMDAAFQDPFREGTMLLTPHSAYGTVPWFFYARVIGYEPAGDFVRRGTRLQFVRAFTLTLRLLDPRFYVAGTPPSISGASAATVAAANDGRNPKGTDPTFAVTVPAGTPDIHLENLSVNTSNGHADMWFRAVPEGLLVVDFRERRITLDDATADGLWDSVDSDWWDPFIPGLKPGSNDIKVTGGAWTMTWKHAG